MATRNIDPSTGAAIWSTAKQSAIGTAASLSTGRTWPRCEKGVIVSGDPWYKLESNRGSQSGGREPDDFQRGVLDPFDMQHTMTADADNMAEILGFHTADPNAASQKGSTGIYLQTGNMAGVSIYEMPYLTAMYMRGDETNGRDKLLLYDGVVDTVNFSANVRDDRFWKVAATVKFTGKHKRNILREGLRCQAWGTSITLTANGVEGSDTATRLRSIHNVKADIAGNGRGLTDVVCSAASDATPCVLTVTEPRKRMVSVYTEVSDSITTMGDGTTATTVTLGTSDYIYFGSDEPLDGAYFDIGATPNALAVTADVEYRKSDGSWTNVTDLVDQTASGGATLAVDGDMFWNLPTDHEPCVLPVSNSAVDAIDKQLLYWYRLCTSGATTASTTITAVYKSRYRSADESYFSDNGTGTDYTTEWNSADGSEAPAVSVTTDDYYYIGSYSPFSSMYYIPGDTTQDAASVLSGEYYNGAWTAVGNLSDGSDVGGDCLQQAGRISWDRTTDDETVVPLTGMTEMYWYRFAVSVNLTAAAYAEMFRPGDHDYRVWITYRCDESVNFTEGQSSNVPSETVIPPFLVQSSKFFYGGYFDGTRCYGGTQIKCDLSSFEWNSSWGTPAPQRCMDGTDNAWAARYQMGKPTQTVKVSIDDYYTMEQLMNAYTDENPNNSTTDTTPIVPLYFQTYGPCMDTQYPEERYMMELIWPYTAMQMKSLSEGDGRYQAEVTWEVGEDNVNSYNSLYYRITSDQSTNYAQ